MSPAETEQPTLLADETTAARPLPLTIGFGAGPAGRATVRRGSDGSWWRAEQAEPGPLILRVHAEAAGLRIGVLGDPGTSPAAVEAAMARARAWAGLDDDLAGVVELLSGNPVLRGLLRRLGPPALGTLPRAAESFGRALLAQRIQGVEAARSTAALLRLLGTPARSQLLAYPDRAALAGVPGHALRPCGISAQATRALHEFARDEPAAQRLTDARDWTRLDALIRRIPGCGGWTSAETRLFLGDADAVSYGDFHTATIVGWAIGERTETDEAMAELLAPFAPHRGRVVRLIEAGARAGLVPVKARRAPRAAISRHRYG